MLVVDLYDAALSIDRGVEATVDLSADDLAVGRRMVVTAEQGAVEVGAGSLQAFDLCVECDEATPTDRLPVLDVFGAEDPGDVVERQAGVLQHADEDQPAQRGLPVAALS